MESVNILAEWERSVCLPLALLINFSLFQYLFTQYHRRRRELRGFILLLCAFGGFLLLVPFANSNNKLVEHFGAISEACSILTFFLQLTIVGRDINRKIRIRSLLYLTYASEMFIVMGLVVAFFNLLAVIYPPLMPAFVDAFATVAKKIALFFILFSRFYFLFKARGGTYLITKKKGEMVAYLLFVTYEYPFMLLETETGLSWRWVEALWLRFTIILCIGMTLQEKLRSYSNASGTGGAASTSRAADNDRGSHAGTKLAVVAPAPTAASLASSTRTIRGLTTKGSSKPKSPSLSRLPVAPAKN